MNRSAVRTPVVALLASLVVALGACGTGSTSQKASGPTGPISFGEMYPATGRAVAFGQRSDRGVKVAVQDINSNGGVLGQPLQSFFADDAGDPVDAVTAIRQLLTHQPAFLSGPNSLTFTAVEPIIDSSQIVSFAFIPGTQFTNLNDKWVYKTGVQDSALAQGMAYYALQKGYKNCALIQDNTASTQSLVPFLVADYKKHGGNITQNVTIVALQSSYRSEVAQAFQGNPQCVFPVITDAQTVATLFGSIRQEGHLNLPFVGTDLFTDINAAKGIGLADVAKWVTAMAGAQPSGPAADHFTPLYKAQFNEAPSDFAASAYDGVVVAALAMTAAGTADPKVWVNWVAKVTNNENAAVVSTYSQGVTALKAGKQIDYEGASGPLDFDAHHNVYTGYDVVQYDASGNLSTVLDIPAATLNSY